MTTKQKQAAWWRRLGGARFGDSVSEGRND